MKRGLLPSSGTVFVALGGAALLSGCAFGVLADSAGDGGDPNVLDAGTLFPDSGPPAHIDSGAPPSAVDASSAGGDASGIDASGGAGDASTADAEADAAPSDAGFDAGSGDSGGGGPTIVCAPPTTCSAAGALSSVNGDTGNQTDTPTGATSAWYVVQVIDTNSWSLTNQELVHITLTSPSGADFDLYTYEASAGSTECSAVAASSTNGPGQVDSVELTWNDVLGSDDSKNITIEVRARAADVCMTGQTWSLTVTGNQ